jgi:hypothetical protein
MVGRWFIMAMVCVGVLHVQRESCGAMMDAYRHTGISVLSSMQEVHKN